MRNNLSICRSNNCINYSGDGAKILAIILSVAVLAYTLSKLMEDTNLLINNLKIIRIMKFVKFNSNGQYYFNLRASNGERMLVSEGYTSSSSRNNGIQSVKYNAPFDHRYDRRISRDNKVYFVLKAANGEIIGTSETYNSEYAMENAISIIKREAPTALVVEQN